MSTICISNLSTQGAHLFLDGESYMDELSHSDTEFVNIQGGSTPCCVAYGGVVLINALWGVVAVEVLTIAALVHENNK
jgi:hypothetical protein